MARALTDPDGTADAFLADMLRDAMRDARNSPEEDEFLVVSWLPWGQVLERIHGNLLELAMAYRAALIRLGLIIRFPSHDLFGQRLGAELTIAETGEALGVHLAAAGETEETVERYLAELRRSRELYEEMMQRYADARHTG